MDSSDGDTTRGAACFFAYRAIIIAIWSYLLINKKKNKIYIDICNMSI